MVGGEEHERVVIIRHRMLGRDAGLLHPAAMQHCMQSVDLTTPDDRRSPHCPTLAFSCFKQLCQKIVPRVSHLTTLAGQGENLTQLQCHWSLIPCSRSRQAADKGSVDKWPMRFRVQGTLPVGGHTRLRGLPMGAAMQQIMADCKLCLPRPSGLHRHSPVPGAGAASERP